MRKIGNRLVAPMFALLLAASITFGIGSVFAQPATAAACRYGPPVFLGTCSSKEVCQEACWSWGAIDGVCREDGCCICVL